MPYPLIDDEPFLSLGDRDEEPASQQVVPVPFGPGHVGTTYLGRRSVFRDGVPLGKHEGGEAIPLATPFFTRQSADGGICLRACDMNDPLAGLDHPRLSWLFWFPSFFALSSFAKATADGASYAGRRATGWCGEFVGSVDQSLTTSATTEMMSMVAEVVRLWSSALGSGILGSLGRKTLEQ